MNSWILILLLCLSNRTNMNCGTSCCNCTHQQDSPCLRRNFMCNKRTERDSDKKCCESACDFDNGFEPIQSFECKENAFFQETFPEIGKKDACDCEQ